MSRKRLNTILGLVLLAGVIYWFYPLVTGAGNMRNFCKALQVNASRQDVERAVARRGFRLLPGKDGTGLINDPRAFGRFICQVKFQNDRLASATYFHND